MNPRENFIAALERRPSEGRVPHFELVLFLTMEALGRVHSSRMTFSQWDQMEEKERQLHREYTADTFILTAEKYDHSAIVLYPMPNTDEELMRLAEIIREKTGDKYFLLAHGDGTFAIPNGNNMLELSYRMADDSNGLKKEANARIDSMLERGQKLHDHGLLDGFVMCSDYCLNTGPFLSPSQFSEFVAPYLAKQIKGYRDMGFYTIKHTDGNIMPIIDQLVEANPHALHSIDPQAGVDIAEVKRLYGKEVCLIGNVNCGLMDTGNDEQVIESAQYALKCGMPGGGYIFSTSNCIYTGMSLARYELMLDVWRKRGNYVLE
ncbi:MAG: uroporphyrinogen decarboxylase family protein [Armatimonadota bacterium]